MASPPDKKELARIHAEKMYYGLFLDLFYAKQGYQSRVEELTEELADAKKNLKKTTAAFIKCEARYKELNNGQAPRLPK